MDSANRKCQTLTDEAALICTHEAELAELAKGYVEKVEAVQTECDRAIASVRKRASQELVKLVASFEIERSAALARFAVKCEEARALRCPPEARSAPSLKRRTGGN